MVDYQRGNDDAQLTQARLKELLHYDPDTGIFTRKINRHAYRAGEIAGSIHRKGYIRISIDRRSYSAHRLAWLYMYGHFPENQIDHINHIKSDNRITNLREVTNQINCRNSRLPKNNKSGIIGVYWNSWRNKWTAIVKVNYQYKFLGHFDDFFEAVCARKSMEIQIGFHPNHGNK